MQQLLACRKRPDYADRSRRAAQPFVLWTPRTPRDCLTLAIARSNGKFRSRSFKEGQGATSFSPRAYERTVQDDPPSHPWMTFTQGFVCDRRLAFDARENRKEYGREDGASFAGGLGPPASCHRAAVCHGWRHHGRDSGRIPLPEISGYVGWNRSRTRALLNRNRTRMVRPGSRPRTCTKATDTAIWSRRFGCWDPSARAGPR
jgi:hypothetical protein